MGKAVLQKTTFQDILYCNMIMEVKFLARLTVLLFLVCLLATGPVVVYSRVSGNRHMRVVDTRRPINCHARDCKFVNSNGDCVLDIPCMLRKLGLG